MKGLKRSSQKFGQVRGHRKGVHGTELLTYREARSAIYLPSYEWVLTHRLQDLLSELRRLEEEKLVLLLDYETNGDIEDMTRPLSHAGLIKRYLEGNWPE